MGSDPAVAGRQRPRLLHALQHLRPLPDGHPLGPANPLAPALGALRVQALRHPRDVRADALEALAWVAGRPWPEQQALLAGLDAAIAAGAENLGYQHWTLADALAEEE